MARGCGARRGRRRCGDRRGPPGRSDPPAATTVELPDRDALAEQTTRLGVRGEPKHVRDAHALAWTENERFLAVATRFAITTLDVASLDRYDAIGSGLRSVTLPLRATDPAWRD